MISALYPKAITNSLIPCTPQIFMMCHRIGLPPISTIGFGRKTVSSDKRDPNPPAKMTAFIALLPSSTIFKMATARVSLEFQDAERLAVLRLGYDVERAPNHSR